MILIDDVCPEGIEETFPTSPSGEYLGMYFYVGKYEHNRKPPWRFDPGLGLKESKIVMLLKI